MTTCKYATTLIFSGLVTLSLLFKGCECVPKDFHVVLDFLAMLGGGIFCSTLVSWLIDIQNQKRDKETRQKQREYILASVKHQFLRLYEREFFEVSAYYTEHIVHNDVKWIRENLSIINIGSMLTRMIDEIECTEKTNDGCIVISLETIRHSEQKEQHLVKRNRIYYDALHQNLLELSKHYNTYLISGIFTETQIDALRDLTFEIGDILTFSVEDFIDDGTILSLKKLFFEKTGSLVTSLDIPKETLVSVHYKKISE